LRSEENKPLADLTPGNVFELPERLPPEEEFISLFETSRVRIERILSSGQITPPGEWYDQSQDEWVLVVQGEGRLTLGDGRQVTLKAGDFWLLPAHTRHRVDFTSANPPCVWLAVHCF
jgi:cupin 2 domain-containing protein